MEYTVNTPVASVVFNRYDKAMQIFERIKQVKPSKFYIIADGPRPGHPTDAENCKKARSVFEKIDWDCQVFKNFAETNLGCGPRLFTGFSWVFQQEERAIILEDDCVPDLSFFPYCDELLEKYKEDERIMLISGSNINTVWQKGEYSYHFAKFGGIHGWASWRRAWQKVDLDITLWQDLRTKQLLKGRLGAWHFYFLSKIYDRLVNHSKNVHTWDYQFDFARFVNSGLAVVPSSNLVTNVGFGEDSTHTKDKNAKAANLKIVPLKFPLVHPPVVVEDSEYDKLVVSILFPKTLRVFLSVMKHELKRSIRKLLS
ncbi:MAG: glycosyltransferase family 2 protein [Sedimentisphaerales bacterium]